MHLCFSLQLLVGAALAFFESTQFPLGSNEVSRDFVNYQSHVSTEHSIRIKRQNSSLCNTPVEQYTGWLDVGHRHLFFWYFASESASDDASFPLTLWLTGGPGGSSMIGMLSELGPCLINEHGNGTTYNPHGWNKGSALLFVDQPAGVGFSYLDDGEEGLGDSFTSAADMHIFLQMFMHQVFPEHKKGPLVISGESYAGHYLPALGSQIVSKNTQYPSQPQVPLKSLAIGNGLVSTRDRVYGYWETLCTTNPGVEEPVFNSTRCDMIAENLPRCMDVIQTCIERPDIAICTAANQVCWDGILSYYDGESGRGGRNRFDITAPCEVDEYCYSSASRVEDYLNQLSTFTSLEVPSSVKNFTLSSDPVYEAFLLNMDISRVVVPQIQYLLSSQIDVLIYQGNLDLACSTASAKRWTEAMPWKGQPAFTSQDLKPWRSIVAGEEKIVGMFKEVNIRMSKDEKTTRFALVTINGAGHMVPQDQPEVALEMLTRWVEDRPMD